MKVLCMYTPCGPSYVRTGWGRVINAIGDQFMFWQPEVKPAFDVFSEFEPDIFIGTTYDLNRAIYKNIAMRPNMKVIMYCSAWGSLIDEIDTNKFPITKVTDDEKRLLEQLKKETGKPDFVFLHYHQNWIDRTLGGWRSIGIEPVSMLNAADTFDYLPGKKRKQFLSHLSFVGGYWPYKAQNLDKFLVPLCYRSNLNIKIFGNQPWNVPQYLGYVDNNQVRDIFASAEICPNISEPHSTEFGFDIVERPFKVLSSGAFCISDYVQSAVEDVFGDSIPVAKTPKEFNELINHYLHNPDDKIKLIEKGQKIVLQNHTYFDRMQNVFGLLGMQDKQEKVIEAKNKYVPQNNLS